MQGIFPGAAVSFFVFKTGGGWMQFSKSAPGTYAYTEIELYTSRTFWNVCKEGCGVHLLRWHYMVSEGVIILDTITLHHHAFLFFCPSKDSKTIVPLSAPVFIMPNTIIWHFTPPPRSIYLLKKPILSSKVSRDDDRFGDGGLMLLAAELPSFDPSRTTSSNNLYIIFLSELSTAIADSVSSS